MKKISICMLLFLSSLGLWAQKNNKIADKAFKVQDYYTAQKFYEMGIKQGEDTGKKIKPRRQAEIYYRMAESCRYIYLFTQAETYYKKVADSPEKLAFIDTDFWYAYTLKHNGKYQAAGAGFAEYLQVTAQDNSPRVQKFRAKAEQEVKACALAPQIVQTPEQGVGLAALGKNINTQYSDFAPHTVGGDLFYSSLRFERQWAGRSDRNAPKEKFLVGKLFSSKERGARASIPLNSLNIKFQSTGNSTVSPDGKWVFFTQCQEISATEVRCALCKSKRKSSYWDKPTRFAAPLNLDEFTSTHPNIGFDSVRMKQVLFFVSNRTGGQGDLDLWWVTMEEVGKDSFAFGTPENLGTVLNTPEADATPFFHTPTQTLYFSSKWHEGLGGFDMFKTKRDKNGQWQKPVNLGVPINSAANDLYMWINQEDTTAYFSSNRTGSKTLTGESCCNDIYAISLPSDFVKTPPDWTFKLPPVPVKVDSPVVVAKIDSPAIVPVKVDTPIVAVKINPEPNPEPAPEPVIPVLIPEPTKPPTDIKTINQLLPISLYFHNDEPDSNTMATSTKIPYAESYEYYMGLKDLYKKEYSRPCKAEADKEKARTLVDEFFDKQVTGEYRRLNECLDAMAAYLEAHPEAVMEIQVCGFASSRAASAYNKNLTKRRISCFRNYLELYDEGKLSEFVDAKKLIIKELPLGEEKSNSKMDALGNPLSIYSVESARERKIEVRLVTEK